MLGSKLITSKEGYMQMELIEYDMYIMDDSMFVVFSRGGCCWAKARQEGYRQSRHTSLHISGQPRPHMEHGGP